MERSFEHKSSQFAVNATFDSFSALKHACNHAVLLDFYEFDPVKVDSERYTIKCKDKECPWYLYATSVSGLSMRNIQNENSNAQGVGRGYWAFPYDLS